MSDNGAEQGLERVSPLFASSWMALYLLLKKEFESNRESSEPTSEEQRRESTETPN